MEYAQLGVWGNIPWKYEVNPFSGLGGDVLARLDIEKEQTDGRTDEQPKLEEL